MNREKHLSTLLRDLPVVFAELHNDPLVTGIAYDSRKITTGSIFVALAGGNVDGHRYIPDALKKGAVAVVGSQLIRGLEAPYIQVQNPRQAMAHLSARFYDFPAHDLVMLGVTGTDGKTTTTNLIYKILLSAGIRAGMISTVNAVVGDQVLDTGFHVTTPEAPEIQRYLHMMRSAGITHVVLEATSHGLTQERVADCFFDLGVLTNITHEHLDFHGSYREYRAAKARLFQYLEESFHKPSGVPRLAVLNRDDESFEYLDDVIPVNKLAYSLQIDADIYADEIQLSANTSQFTVHTKTRDGSRNELGIKTSLVGIFNVYNCLAAIGATVGGLDINPQAAIQGAAEMTGIPGRMERIDLGQSFLAMVDFAHTPNALYRALEAARLFSTGRVIAVFGSAGLRDRQKRRLMAEVSVEMADLTILTAEDPRTESLPGILDEMAQGAAAKGGEEGSTFWRIPDRRDAIRFAVDLAQPADLVIVCGKGHEQSMCFGEIEYAWDDRVALRAALAERFGLEGPAMPELPDF